MDLCSDCLAPGQAWVVIAAAAAMGALAAFVLRTRAPVAAVAGLLAVAGAGVGWGGIQLTDGASALEAWLATAGLAVLVPFHVRIVLGPLGRRG